MKTLKTLPLVLGTVLLLSTFYAQAREYKPGSREWLKTQISSNWLNFKSSGKKIRLMYIAEFVNWFNHEF